jgi:hemerythrin
MKGEGTMSFIDWEDMLSTGVQRYDEQHKKLITLINNLYNAMQEGMTEAQLEETFKGLIDYTNTHFSDEEEKLKAYNYPGYEEHAEAHRILEKKVAEYNAQYESHTLSLKDFMNFLHDWLINHIMHIDRQYGEFLKEKGVE